MQKERLCFSNIRIAKNNRPTSLIEVYVLRMHNIYRYLRKLDNQEIWLFIIISGRDILY